MAATAAVGVLSSMSSQRMAAKQADDRRKAEITGALAGYNSKVNSTNIMLGANREAFLNNANEVLRAGAAKEAKIEQEVQKAQSSLSAQSEGLTSGRSQGRKMVDMQMQANKIMQDTKSQTGMTLSQLADAKDQQQNKLSLDLLNAYDSMAATLTTPGATYQGNVWQTVSAGIQGAAVGASLDSAFAASSGASGGTQQGSFQGPLMENGRYFSKG